MATEHLTKYPNPHHVVVPYRTIYPNGKPEASGEDEPRTMQQVRTIVVDGMPLCLPMDGTLSIEPMVGGGGHKITVQIYADSIDLEPNPDL